jgi:hypothetical protein
MIIPLNSENSHGRDLKVPTRPISTGLGDIDMAMIGAKIIESPSPRLPITNGLRTL